MDSFVAGVDIGGTGTKFGIVDNLGNVLLSDTMSTKGHADIYAYIDELHDKLMVLIEKVGGVGRIKGIGLGAPNGNVYTGTIEYAPNLPWKGIIPLTKLIQDKFKLPGYVQADVYLTMRINRVRLFFKFANVTQGLLTDNYYTTYLHPAMGRSFGYGVRWLLFD
jgi:predicted NBD/HSP70 family sugar kinase